MNLQQEFFLNGFIEYQLKSSNNLDKLLNDLNKINIGKIKPGFEMKQKYKNTLDLSPSVYNYSSSFFEILKENSIPELLYQLTQKNNFCYHVQLRKTLPSGNSYMSNHRDSYIKNNKVVGNIPPPIKIIFYPRLNSQKENRLKVISGSHIKFYQNYYFDRIINSFGKKRIVKSSNSTILIFNTMIYHSIFPEKDKNGSLRLIYSFGDENLIKNYNHNQHLIDCYKNQLL